MRQEAPAGSLLARCRGESERLPAGLWMALKERVQQWVGDCLTYRPNLFLSDRPNPLTVARSIEAVCTCLVDWVDSPAG